MPVSGWIGVDLDGTLAHYAGWKGPDHIGEPIAAMVKRVKAWLAEGVEVRIFTARVGMTGLTNPQGNLDGQKFADEQVRIIQEWTERHIGIRLPVTATKDFAMIELWDDRCRQVEMNTGRAIDESCACMGAALGRIARMPTNL